VIFLASIILPYDTTAESGVVCTLIQNPEMISHCEFLKPSHFYHREYASVYWAIGELVKDGIFEIDKLNLIVKLNEKKGVRKIIDEFGGESFISDVIDNSPYAMRESTEQYANIARRVSELGFKRELYTKLKVFENKCLNTEIDLNELNSEIITSLDGLAEEFVSNEKVVLYKDKIDDIIKSIEEKRARSKDGIIGMATAWDALSELIRYEDGDLYLFAARRKMGKSLILTSEALHKAKAGLHVAMFSTEMSDEKDTLRILSILSGIPIEDIRRGNIQGYSEQKYKDAIHFLKHASFTREYNPRWTRDMVNIRLKAIKHKLGGLDLFVHDYIKDPESSDSNAKYNELGKWADFLKNQIGGHFGIPVLSAVQLNRQDAVADSDLIERYASCGVKWTQKTKEEIMADGLDCGNYKMRIFFSRDGGQMEEDDYLDFYMDGRKETANLRIYEAKNQHDIQVPTFMQEKE
jgi:replicative DNA helicase